LRELANVGCGHAASALSRLVGGPKIQIDVPTVVVAGPEELPSRVAILAERVLVATLQVHGDIEGHVLLALAERDALCLAALLLRAPAEASLGDEHRSALSEAANIVGSACLSAIGQLTGFRLLPSVPSLSHCAALDDALRAAEGSGVMVVLEARFTAAATLPFEGRMFVIPATKSLRRLLERLGV